MPQRAQDDNPPPASGLVPGSRIWVCGHNVFARQTIEEMFPDFARPPEGPIDAGFLTPATVDEAMYFAKKIRLRLEPHARIWIILPKPGSTHQDAFQGDREELVLELFQSGYAEIARTALGDEYLTIEVKRQDSSI